MRLTIPHGTTTAEARTRIEGLLDSLARRYRDQVEVLERAWEGDSLHFSIRARGMSARGRIDVRDRDVEIAGNLPLLARPLEPRLRKAILHEAESLFPEGGRNA